MAETEKTQEKKIDPSTAAGTKALETEAESIKDQVSSLEEQVDELKTKSDSYLNSWARTQAELENYRKMVKKQEDNYKRDVRVSLFKKLIPHLEDLERAAQVMESKDDLPPKIIEGIKMIYKNFRRLLEKEGVRRMDVVGKKFDPYAQEVVLAEVDNSVEEETVLEEIERGYYLDDLVLKPARVKVSRQE